MSWKIQYINSSSISKRQRGGTRKDDSQQEFYARMASIAYGKSQSDKKKKAEKLGFMIDEDLSNDDVSILTNDKTKEVVYSISGTRLSQPKHRFRDLGEDLLITLGLQKFSSRKKDVKEIINKAQQKYKGYESTITAHSLGGNIGKQISKETGIDAVLFNIGSSPLSVLSDKVTDILNRSLRADVFKHYNVKSDPVSISERLLGNDIDVVDVKKKDKINPHTLKQFHDENIMEGGGRNFNVKKNPWLLHVSNVRKKNPDMKYKDVLKTASSTYTKNTQSEQPSFK